MKSTIKVRLKEHRWDISTWAVLEPELIYSEAFATLSSSAMRVLIRFLQKRSFPKSKKERKRAGKGFVFYDTPLIFTYLEAECLGFSKSTFSRAIKELYRVGFIAIEHQGGSIGTGRDWSQYRLINDWKYYGTEKFEPREKEAPPLRTSKTIREYNAAGRPKHKKSKSTIVTSDTRTVSRMTPWSPVALAGGYSEVTMGNFSLIDHELAHGDLVQPLSPHINQSPIRVSGMTLFI